MYQHPNVPWIQFRPVQGGFEVYDTRAGDGVFVTNEMHLHQFAAERASAGGMGGLGDAVAAVAEPIARAFGKAPCTPCARRKAMLNGMAPNLYRR
jgi:hypothetical protein